MWALLSPMLWPRLKEMPLRFKRSTNAKMTNEKQTLIASTKNSRLVFKRDLSDLQTTSRRRTFKESTLCALADLLRRDSTSQRE